ncbi:hypothetical protein R1sor_000359 [Riccia sorocarpa]|uniref:DUF7869 domain-containing protein n=1 Tax=Riccia sorocarpa TaxID=122646 RepID=A0ABD3GSW3_9MARC
MKRLHIGGCIPLPISLTGMLTHGREPGIFCHLSLTGLWPGDPNFTVSSLARCIRDLEQVPDNGDHTGDLSRTSSRVFLTRQLSKQRWDEKGQLTLLTSSSMALVNFLMVGHTHEDIDALFSKPIGFRFSMANNVPIYKFQAKVDGPWMPEGGHSLWKKRNGQFIFPKEEPRALPLPSTHPRLGEVSPFINNLITFLKDTYYKDETSEGYRKYSPVVSYWERVKANLTRIQPLQEEKLQSGFWPQTNHGTGFMTNAQYEDGLRVEQDEPGLDELEKELQAENEMQLQPYVGPPSLRPKRAFVPLEDICEGNFVVLRPEDDFEVELPRAVWLGRVMGPVVRDNNDEHHGQFQIEWWRPRHRKSTNATNKERYSSLLVGQKDWEKDPGYNTPH